MNIENLTLQQLEQWAITSAMHRLEHNRTAVVRHLKMGRTTLYRKLAEYASAGGDASFMWNLKKSGCQQIIDASKRGEGVYLNEGAVHDLAKHKSIIERALGDDNCDNARSRVRNAV